jgi:hypothetical protein
VRSSLPKGLRYHERGAQLSPNQSGETAQLDAFELEEVEEEEALLGKDEKMRGLLLQTQIAAVV